MFDVGKIALWKGDRDPIVYRGQIEVNGLGTYRVTLSKPDSDKGVLYEGKITAKVDNKNQTFGYIDFYKTQLDGDAKAVGLLQWNDAPKPTLKILLFYNDNVNGAVKAPTFKGFIVPVEPDDLKETVVEEVIDMGS